MVPEPFYFGRREHLFGLYHPAKNNRRRHGVVVCPPLLNEYMRSHHALRRVALALADAGYDVLRFDFSGQGNSLGATTDVTCADWSADVGDALTDIQSIADIDAVSVVAARFACSLVARQSRDQSLSRLVCWDPIFDGAEWYRMLQRVQGRLKSDSGAPERIGAHEYMGYEMSPAFAASLREHRYLPTNVPTVIAVQTAAGVAAEGYDTVRVEFNCRWEEMSSQVLYPHEVVTALCRPFS